jgi:hypothetical protein
LILFILIGCDDKNQEENIVKESQKAFSKILMEKSSELNQNCPYMVDENTRLDGSVSYENTFEYKYTLLSIDKDDVDVNELNNYLKPRIINGVSTNPDMFFFRENNMDISYYYKDKNGFFLTKIIVTPKDYNHAN